MTDATAESADRPDVPRGLSAARAVLKVPDFRYLVAANLVVFFAFEARTVAQSWLALELTDSQAWVGIVAGAPAFATVAFSLVGGAASDSFAKRNILLVVRLALAVVAFSVGYLVASGAISVWHLVGFAMVQGAILAFGMPASMTIAYDIVGKERLFSAMSVNQAVANLGAVVGPAVGGVLLGIIGIGPVYYVIGGLYLVSFVLMLRVRTRGHTSRDARSAGGISEGLRYALRSRLVGSLLILNALSIFLGVIIPLIPVYARDVLQVGERGYGVMLGAFGIGTVLSAVAITMLSGIRRKSWLILLAVMIFTSTMVAFAFSRSFPLSIAILFLMGTGVPIYVTTVNTLLQTSVPDRLRGRIMGLNMIVFQLFGVGMLLGGALAAATSNEIALVSGGVANLVGVLTLFGWSKELREAE